MADFEEYAKLSDPPSMIPILAPTLNTFNQNHGRMRQHDKGGRLGLVFQPTLKRFCFRAALQMYLAFQGVVPAGIM